MPKGTPQAHFEQTGFDRASWAILALALLIVALSLAQALYYLSLPSDGWSFVRDASGTGTRLVFAGNLAGTPSQIAPGDELVAVEGQPIERVLARALLAQPQRPPRWAEAPAARYTILRGGRSITHDVPLVHMPRAALARNLAWYYLGDPSLLPAILVGAFVFLHSPRSRAARLLFLLCTCFFAANGICQAVRGSNALGPADLLDGFSYWPAAFFNTLIWPFVIAPLFMHLFLSFPAPKWPGRVHQRLALSVCYGVTPALTLLALALHWGRPLDFWSTWGRFSVGVYFSTLIAVVLCLAHTLSTACSAKARAQIRWVAWGTIVTCAGAITGGILGSLGILGEYPPLDFMAFRLPMLAFPVALALAITRYQLFDIDIIINRTLVYSTLTVVLALVYGASVVLLQGLFRALTWESQDALVTVGSTLTIALLFSPLRRRIQSLIDRRFFRRNYDAARIMTAFSATMRDEVDLNQLAGDLVEVVEDTMQPVFVSLWLCTTSGCLHASDTAEPIEPAGAYPCDRLYAARTIQGQP
jgi:hypothetical protein